MPTVNMLDAKTTLSKLVDAVERGEEAEIIIARNGRPAARLVPFEAISGRRIGVAKGRVRLSDAFHTQDDRILELFEGAEE